MRVERMTRAAMPTVNPIFTCGTKIVNQLSSICIYTSKCRTSHSLMWNLINMNTVKVEVRTCLLKKHFEIPRHYNTNVLATVRVKFQIMYEHFLNEVPLYALFVMRAIPSVIIPATCARAC